MLKYSDNLIVESIDNSSIKVIQSKNGSDFIVILSGVKTPHPLKVCLQTDKFILVEAEGIKEIKAEKTQVSLETSDGSYILPIMRERGIFLVEPPVNLPSVSPEVTWEYDFSGKSINTSFNENMGMASSLVIVGDNLVARNISNVMEVYGDSHTARLALSPKQYSLVQKTGKAKVSLWSTGEAVFSGDNGVEVAIKSTKQKLDIAGVESRITSNKSLLKADLSSFKVKTFGKFILEKIVLSFYNEKVVFVSDSARKVIDCPGLEVTEPLSLEVMSKDLKYLSGQVSVSPLESNGQTRYVIRVEDKNKVVYVLTAKARN